MGYEMYLSRPVEKKIKGKIDDENVKEWAAVVDRKGLEVDDLGACIRVLLYCKSMECEI